MKEKTKQMLIVVGVMFIIIVLFRILHHFSGFDTDFLEGFFCATVIFIGKPERSCEI